MSASANSMNMPSAYTKGYEAARAIDPVRARNYVAHTVIGDPKADELLEELALVLGEAGTVGP